MLLTILTCFFASNSVFAAPLTDYSPSKVAIDIMIRNNDLKGSGNGFSFSFDKKWNAEYGLTLAFGGNLAFQYTGFGAKSDDTSIDDNGMTKSVAFKLKSDEFNLLYQVHKAEKSSAAVFLGYTRAKVSTWHTDFGKNSSSEEGYFQLGALGTIKIAPKTTAYAAVRGGDDIFGYKVGISQDLGRGFEMNVDWSYMKAKNIGDRNSAFGQLDAVNKGIGLGITYKFS